MKVRVVSCMWGSAWERYGESFATSFARFWPARVELVVVADQALPLERGRTIDLGSLPGFVEFKARWGHDKKANGYDRPPGSKVNENGYSWRHDAVKWMPQGLSAAAALDGLVADDILLWFDADVETIARVPTDYGPQLLGDFDVARLARPNTHSEIGFHGVRISAYTIAMLQGFATIYTSGAFQSLPESHSAYVYDRAVEAFPMLRVRNLNEGGGKGHVWPKIPLLANYTAHYKGERKDKR